jgi:hypothetical protein
MRALLTDLEGKGQEAERAGGRAGMRERRQEAEGAGGRGGIRGKEKIERSCESHKCACALWERHKCACALWEGHKCACAL